MPQSEMVGSVSAGGILTDSGKSGQNQFSDIWGNEAMERGHWVASVKCNVTFLASLVWTKIVAICRREFNLELKYSKLFER